MEMLQILYSTLAEAPNDCPNDIRSTGGPFDVPSEALSLANLEQEEESKGDPSKGAAAGERGRDAFAWLHIPVVT